MKKEYLSYKVGDELIVVNNPDYSVDNGKMGTVVEIFIDYIKVLLQGETFPGEYRISTFRKVTALDKLLE